MPNEFAVTHFAYLEYPTFVRVRTLTFEAVHLTCHYTSATPVRHRMTVTSRGLQVPQGAYWCFVATKQVEQDEPGDTLVHTFTIPDWLIGVRYYLVWTGTVASLESPSLSVFIEHTNSGADPLITEEQTTGVPFSSTTDGTSWGQLLTIPKRELSALSFYLYRYGWPGGVVDYFILGTPIETLLWNARLGPANNISTTPTWYTIPFPTPTIINGIVRILVQASAGDGNNAINVHAALTDVKPNEYLTWRSPPGAYRDFPLRDFLYRYTYLNWQPYLLP